MTTPVHAHPSDGSYYPDCPRCRIERAAPELLDALKGYISGHPCSSQEQEPEAPTNCPTLIAARTAIAKAETA